MSRARLWGLNILLALVVVASGYLGTKQHALADDGAQAHEALCVFRADIQRRADDSEKFLALTPEERIDKYGVALGTIPPNVIRNSLANQQQTLDSLGALDCQ